MELGGWKSYEMVLRYARLARFEADGRPRIAARSDRLVRSHNCGFITFYKSIS